MGKESLQEERCGDSGLYPFKLGEEVKPVGGRNAAEERGEERKNGFVEVGGNDGMNRFESGDCCLQNGIRLGVQAAGVERKERGKVLRILCNFQKNGKGRNREKANGVLLLMGSHAPTSSRTKASIALTQSGREEEPKTEQQSAMHLAASRRTRRR